MKYKCFTWEQQDAYDKLNDKHKLYVDLRGKGFGKKEAYEKAGYGGKNTKQAGYLLERNNSVIADLIETLTKQAFVGGLSDEDSKINKQIDALALQDGAEKVIKAVEGAGSENAKRIQFYRDVISGKIKTTKRITERDSDGKILKVKTEEISDVASKMTARKELDKILGMNDVIDLSKFKVGDITVNIVDASKKEELEDSRNTIVLEDVEVV